MNDSVKTYSQYELINDSARAIEVKNSWGKKYGTDYDRYQLFGFNNIRNTDLTLLPYYFSEINIKFIHNKVIDYIKKTKNITINTSQDINHLLNNMVINYQQLKCPQNNEEDDWKKTLGYLNKITIEQYIKSVISTMDMTKYYLDDISHLPQPIDHPTYIAPANKGQNVLGFLGHFSDNHKYTDSLNSFNLRFQ